MVLKRPPVHRDAAPLHQASARGCCAWPQLCRFEVWHRQLDTSTFRSWDFPWGWLYSRLYPSATFHEIWTDQVCKNKENTWRVVVGILWEYKKYKYMRDYGWNALSSHNTWRAMVGILWVYTTNTNTWGAMVGMLWVHTTHEGLW